MLSVWTIVGCAGHALAALIFASLAILTSRRAGRDLETQSLVVALALTALWSLRHALSGVLQIGTLTDGVAETVRNGAWLVTLALHLRRAPAQAGLQRVRPLFVGALALLLVVQLVFDLFVGEYHMVSPTNVRFVFTSWMLRCLFAVGALVLLNGLAARREHPLDRRREAWVGAALAFMWAYDFNHYVLAWLSGGEFVAVGPMRGFVMALIAIPFTVGLRTDGARSFALSRPVALRLASLTILGLYLLSAVALVVFSVDEAAPLGRITQMSLLFGLSVSVLALLPSTALRAWLRVVITKHLFAYRYDYRQLWMGFAASVSETGSEPALLEERLTRAIAEAVQAPSAALFLKDKDGALPLAQAWHWPYAAHDTAPLLPALGVRLQSSGWIVDVRGDWETFAGLLPGWMKGHPHAWVIAPLIHREELLGVIILGRPLGSHKLDWEDLDVLRVVCGEAAARLSEVRSLAALAEAQRFDEFNRRFAFILHDIKNLASQMSLLASNAARHADNPAFREDMILTLNETASRMSDLLQRLGRPGASAGPIEEPVELGALLRAMLPRWNDGDISVELSGDVVRPVRAAARDLERALDHLVRNAIEASAPGLPVHVRIVAEGERASIAIEDHGCGMSGEFMRDSLFRPFSSTKPTGFGIGAHEARLLVQRMGGALDVSSSEGVGTVFTLRLPYADAPAQPQDLMRKAV